MQRNSAFWGDLFVNFHNISYFLFRLTEPLWLIIWVSVVAQWYFKYILLQRVISFVFTCGMCHCYLTGPVLMQSKQNYDFQYTNL